MLIKPGVYTAVSSSRKSALLCLVLFGQPNIGFGKFKESVQALGRAYKPFVSIMDALKPRLQSWFLAVYAHPKLFSIPSCRYLVEMAQVFPSLTDGCYPKQIIDPRGFSPLVNMR
jgi:hypothetical protein